MTTMKIITVVQFQTAALEVTTTTTTTAAAAFSYWRVNSQTKKLV